MSFIRDHSRFLSAILFLLLILGLPSLFYPFGRDQGIHAQVGAAWLEGKLPYLNVWHPKGFLSFVPHFLATAIFGHKMFGIRLIDLIWQFSSGLLIFLIGKQRMSKRGALVAVGLYYLVYYAFGFWHTAQPEGFLTPFLLLAVWFYDRAADKHQQSTYLFISGFTIALTPWFKQTAVVFIIGLLVWVLYDIWRIHQPFNKITPFLSGIILANTLFLAFTIIIGIFSPMLEAFGYAFFQYPKLGGQGLVTLVQQSISWVVLFPALICPFLAGFGYIIFNRSSWPNWLGIVLMALAGLASIYIQQQLWAYHWISSLPFMTLIGGFILEKNLAFVQSLASKKQNGIVWLFALACLSFAMPSLNRHLIYDINVISYLAGRTSQKDYLEEYDMLDVIETAEYLKANTDRDELLFVWGHYAIIYYLANRSNSTRFINDPPLSLPHSRLAEWRQESAEDLTVDPPAYIIVANNDTTSFEERTSKEQLSDFIALASLLTERYQLETVIGDFELYAIK